MADKKSADKKEVVENGGNAQDLQVESAKVGSRVSLEIDLGDIKFGFDIPADSPAARYLEEHGIINP